MRGYYFLADDRIIDWVKVFLSSFRRYNPNANLCLIPHSGQIKQIWELRNKYNFSILDKEMNYYDNISQLFWRQDGRFRKLAMWEGEFDEFIYVDTDIVILENLDSLFKYLEKWDFISNDVNDHNAWKKIPPNFTNKQVHHSFNSGFFISRKGLIIKEFINGHIKSVVALKDYMTDWHGEQSLLNYFISMTGCRCSSLDREREQMGAWVGLKGGKIKDGKIYFKRHNDYLFLHWAGEWQARWIDRLFGRKVIRYFMPYKKLWKYWRYINKEK